MESWSSEVIKFNPRIIDESKRIIEGIATAPVYDRVNELITSDAIKKALPDYMKLPVVTVLHKDYAVGVTKEARILEDGSLFVKVQLKDTPDVDGIWDLIKSGVLNSFSISGSRTDSTCTSNSMGTPCVTRGIHLSTITICGNDAANQKAHISHVYKMLFSDNMTEEVKTEGVIENPVEKTVVQDNSEVLTAISELAKTVNGLVEGMKVQNVEQEVIENPIEKSIGDLTTSLGELTSKLTAIETRLTALEETKVEKGGIIVTESGELKPVGNIKLENFVLNRFKRE